MDFFWRLDEDDGETFATDLHPKEVSAGRRYRHTGRHRQWQHGRVLAKRLLREKSAELGIPDLPPAEIWIQRLETGAPRVLDAEGRPLPVHLSISHREGYAAVAVRAESRGPMGIDLERVEPRSSAFVQDYFSAGERALLDHEERDLRVNLIWSVKEAVLKALGTGLAAPVGRIEVVDIAKAGPLDWHAALVHLDESQATEVLWRRLEPDMVISLARLC